MQHPLNIEKCYNSLTLGECLNENDIRQIVCKIREILIEENNVVKIETPVNICGDTNGQLWDLLEIFTKGGHVPNENYIFMGNYVNYCTYSLENFMLLLLTKIKYPEGIVLLRGSNECREATKVYGLYDECMRKYDAPNVWNWCQDVFEILPIAALIPGLAICIHSGISPTLTSIDDVIYIYIYILDI